MPQRFPTQTARADTPQRAECILEPGDRVYDPLTGATYEGDGVTLGGIEMPSLGARAVGARLTKVAAGLSRTVPNDYQADYFDACAVYGSLAVYGAVRVL